MDGLGEGIETDRIGAEGRLYEDKDGDEEVDKERDSLRRRGSWMTVAAWLGASTSSGPSD